MSILQINTMMKMALSDKNMRSLRFNALFPRAKVQSVFIQERVFVSLNDAFDHLSYDDSTDHQVLRNVLEYRIASQDIPILMKSYGQQDDTLFKTYMKCVEDRNLDYPEEPAKERYEDRLNLFDFDLKKVPVFVNPFSPWLAAMPKYLAVSRQAKVEPFLVVFCYNPALLEMTWAEAFRKGLLNEFIAKEPREDVLETNERVLNHRNSVIWKAHCDMAILGIKRCELVYYCERPEVDYHIYSFNQKPVYHLVSLLQKMGCLFFTALLPRFTDEMIKEGNLKDIDESASHLEVWGTPGDLPKDEFMLMLRIKEFLNDSKLNWPYNETMKGLEQFYSVVEKHSGLVTCEGELSDDETDDEIDICCGIIDLTNDSDGGDVQGDKTLDKQQDKSDVQGNNADLQQAKGEDGSNNLQGEHDVLTTPPKRPRPPTPGK